MPAAGSKKEPKIPGELKDDTSSSREEKQVILYFPKMNYKLILKEFLLRSSLSIPNIPFTYHMKWQ